MSRTRLSATVLGLALLFGVLFRLHAVTQRDTITHDEGITYLAATGHLAEFTELYYNHDAPYGQWVEASRWKRFWQRDQFWCFRKISWDLARYDIHPPLYFWLLHAWIALVGVHVWSGALLNVIITIAMALVLFRFARYVLADPVHAAVVVFVWAVNPHGLQESLEGRAYGLFALFTVLLVGQVARALNGARPVPRRRLAAVTLATLGGALTHYHFALVVAGATAFVAWRLVGRATARLVSVVGAMAMGYVLFFVVHPLFFHSLARGRDQSQPFRVAELPDRLTETAGSLASYLVPAQIGPMAVLIGAAAIVVAVAVAAFRHRHDENLPVGRIDTVVFFLVWTSACVVFLYVTFISPRHAMGPKYLSPVWPFLAFVPVLLARWAPVRTRRLLLIGFCAYQVLYAGGLAARAQFRPPARTPQAAILSRADALVVDTVARGVLPRILFDVPDSLPVYAAMQDHMLANANAWRPRLDRGVLYATNNEYGNSVQSQITLRAMMEEAGALVEVEGGLWSVSYFRYEPAR